MHSLLAVHKGLRVAKNTKWHNSYDIYRWLLNVLNVDNSLLVFKFQKFGTNYSTFIQILFCIFSPLIKFDTSRQSIHWNLLWKLLKRSSYDFIGTSHLMQRKNFMDLLHLPLWNRLSGVVSAYQSKLTYFIVGLSSKLP